MLEEGDAGGGQKRVHEGGEKDEEEGVEKGGGGEDDEGQEGKDFEVKPEEKLSVSLDLDAFLDRLGLSESDMKLPTTESQKASPASSASSSKPGSLHSLQSSSEPTAMAPNITVLSLKGLPPRDPASRSKARSSTLPPRQRGPESGHSLPRSSHSTSLTRFQQMSAQGSLLPLHIPLAPSTSKPLSFSNTPLSPTHVLQSPPANPPTTLPKPLSPSELFMLKEQPGRDARSRAKGRCSTLPARPRGPESGDSSAKPSQSTSFTKMEDFVPPSPSKLKHDTPV